MGPQTGPTFQNEPTGLVHLTYGMQLALCTTLYAVCSMLTPVSAHAACSGPDPVHGVSLGLVLLCTACRASLRCKLYVEPVLDQPYMLVLACRAGLWVHLTWTRPGSSAQGLSDIRHALHVVTSAACPDSSPTCHVQYVPVPSGSGCKGHVAPMLDEPCMLDPASATRLLSQSDLDWPQIECSGLPEAGTICSACTILVLHAACSTYTSSCAVCSLSQIGSMQHKAGGMWAGWIQPAVCILATAGVKDEILHREVNSLNFLWPWAHRSIVGVSAGVLFSVQVSADDGTI